jgi:hypothetical protein
MTLRWTDVAAALDAEPKGTRVRLARALVPHPLDGGLVRALALPVGQRADFRLRVGGRMLLVQDFGSHYEAFLDDREGDDPPLPGGPLTAGATAGALLALLIGGTREATLVGALLGAVLTRRPR